MHQTHADQALAIGHGFQFSQHKGDEGGGISVFGDRFSSGAEKLVAAARYLFQEECFEYECCNFFHYYSRF